MDSPLEPAEGTSPANTLILMQENLLWISDLQHGPIINLSSFKSVSLWKFVRAAIGNSNIGHIYLLGPHFSIHTMTATEGVIIIQANG